MTAHRGVVRAARRADRVSGVVAFHVGLVLLGAVSLGMLIVAGTAIGVAIGAVQDFSRPWMWLIALAVLACWGVGREIVRSRSRQEGSES